MRIDMAGVKEHQYGTTMRIGAGRKDLGMKITPARHYGHIRHLQAKWMFAYEGSVYTLLSTNAIPLPGMDGTGVDYVAIAACYVDDYGVPRRKTVIMNAS